MIEFIPFFGILSCWAFDGYLKHKKKKEKRYEELFKKYEPELYAEMKRKEEEARIKIEQYFDAVREEEDIKEYKRLKSKFEK